jgi:transposase
MTLKRRQFTKEFKLQVLREIEAGKSVVRAAREHQVHPNTITKWRQQYKRYADRAFAGPGRAYTDEAKIAELERLIGQLTVENTFLKKLLQTLETTQQVRP